MKPSESFTEEASDYWDLDYEPKYSWQRRMIELPPVSEDTEVMLAILKSQYLAQVFIIGHDMGRSVSCFTYIRLRITIALNTGGTNEILKSRRYIRPGGLRYVSFPEIKP